MRLISVLRQYLYTVWCTAWVVTLFLGLVPLLYVTVQKKTWLPYHQRLMRFWAEAFCWVAGIRVSVRNTHKFSTNETYIFCGNHFSSFDNLTIALLLKQPFAVIGLRETTQLPIFGYFFKELHIIIDRSCRQSKKRAFWKSLKLLKSGRSMIISPEGGIRSLTPPAMHYPFEDGAFVLAIKSQRPVVPFTLHTNYRILPEFPLRCIHRYPFVAEFHDPIPTVGMTMADLGDLKEQTYQIIQTALNRSAAEFNQKHTSLEKAKTPVYA